jgi:pimeloyl-ACP methyl ester carboxylesterase
MANKPILNVDTKRMAPVQEKLHRKLRLILAMAVALASAAAVTAEKLSTSGATTEKTSTAKVWVADGESRYARFEVEASDFKGEVKESEKAAKEARVHYKSYGDKNGKSSEALVLIHGWTCTLDYWRDSIPELAKRNRVIAIDLPGHGWSDKPDVTYSMDLFSRAVEAVMRDAKVKRAVLVGHSMGTPVARQFYRKYPAKTLGIVIVDGSLRPFGDKKLMDTFLAGFRGPNYKEAGKQMFAGMAGPNLSPEIMGLIQASFLNTPQHVLVSAMEGMADDSIWGGDKINVPVLAYMAKSPFWPPDTEQFYRSLAPNLDFQMVEGVGHFLMMEKPKEFNAAVIAYLDRNKLLK